MNKIKYLLFSVLLFTLPLFVFAKTGNGERQDNLVEKNIVMRMDGASYNLANTMNGYGIEDDKFLWLIEDTKIVKVENNEIIPINVGSTIISTTIDNIDYVFNVNVTYDDSFVNPNTGSSMRTIILFIIGICFIVYSFTREKDYVKDNN